MTWGRKSNRIVPSDWKRRRARVLAQHGHVCHVCGHGQAEQVDHLLNVARGGTHDESNLAPIHGAACPSCGRRCHVEKTATESVAARSSARRPAGRHPGLL